MEHEELFARIEAAAAASPGRNIRNPRYFAEMLAGTVACNPSQDRIALEEIASAMERIAVRQRVELGP